ncbi:hypothetical protein C8Q74DRAFT_1451704 [Fomes fomentarius]|nr:hypothetical protein C8Q74DRAFT_1451704 [Fomes fomentarius]
MLLFSLHRATPLPLEFAHTDPTVSSAYDICLKAQQHVDANPASFPKRTLINIRILGYMLTHLSNTDAVIAAVAKAITSSQPSSTVDHVESNSVDMNALNELGQFYMDFFLRPFRKIEGRTPGTESHPSRPSFELTQEEVRAMLAETPKDHSQSRTLAMRREGHRCIVSRSMDFAYYKACRADGLLVDTRIAQLEFCHIFSQSTKAGLENAAKREYATNAWAVLQSLGYIEVVQDVAAGQKVHSLENVMMMDRGLQVFFHSLALWYEPVEGTSDRYRVVQACPISFDLPDEVEFKCHDPLVPLPLPNPEYLRIHAAVCRISWLSGASALFDELQEDVHENPDAATDMPAFTKSLYARLEHISIVER